MLAGSSITDFWRASEFTHSNQEGIIEHTTIAQIIDQGRIGPVENGTMPILKKLEIKNMSVPTKITIGRKSFHIFAPVYLNVGNTGFSESTGQ